jgi:hypothetical protein
MTLNHRTAAAPAQTDSSFAFEYVCESGVSETRTRSHSLRLPMWYSSRKYHACADAACAGALSGAVASVNSAR